MEKERKHKDFNMSFSNFFYLVSKKDMIYFILGIIFTILNGCMQSVFSLLCGEVAQQFQAKNTPNKVERGALEFLGWFTCFGTISLMLSTLMMYCLVLFGESQAIKFRQEYYKQLINQDVSYFDLINSNELSTKVSSDCFKIQQAIGEKLCIFLYSISIVVSNLSLSLIKAWDITLISCIIIPVSSLIVNIVAKSTQKFMKDNSSLMQTAGGITEQAISAIKTVKNLQGEQHEANKYTQIIQKALSKLFRFNFLTGVSIGFQTMVYFIIQALPLWIVSMNSDAYSASDVITMLVSLLLASLRVSNIMNSMKIFQEAKIACSDILKVLKSIPSISLKDNGIKVKKEDIKGEIIFEGVQFSYPSRKQEILLKDASFTIQSQKKIAIVGKSGCGKSTILQLIEQFYQPTQGRILLDGVDIKNIEPNSLRKAIGYVSQEPVLFTATIRENLRYAKPDADEKEMISALQLANIWEFINSLENKLDTLINNSNSQLSGGQKQRICIARAILKNPPILLLDEATSALDAKNEVQVQAALDQASIGRTTIIIAHNLKTIKNADQIIVIDQGQVIELGTHDQLIAKQGFYYGLQLKQNIISEDSKEQNQEQQKSSPPSSDSSPTEMISPSLPLFMNNKLQIPLQSKNTLPTMTTMNDLNIRILNQQSEINTLNCIDEKVNINVQDDKNNLINNQTQQINIEKKAQERKQIIDQIKKNQPLKIISLKKLSTSKSPKTENIIQIKENEYENEKNRNIDQMTTFEVIKRLFSIDRKASISLSIGLLFSIVDGVVYPLCGWILGKLFITLLDPENEDIQSQCRFYSIILLIIGIVDFVSIIIQYYFTSTSAKQISFILRRNLFIKYLKLPMSWFDKPDNNSSQLSLNIQQNCTSVHNLFGQSLAYNFQAFISLATSLLISFSGDWRTSLVGYVVTPLLIISNFIYALKISQLSMQSQKSSNSTATLINESACNIRTIISFGNPQLLIQNFAQKLSENIKTINKFALRAGFSLGLVNFTLFFKYGVIYYMGALFYKQYGVSKEAIFISLQCLIMSASGFGKSVFFLGDTKSSAIMAKSIFKVLDSKDEFQQNQGTESKINCDGEIEFKNVTFSYPERKDQVILKNLSFKIPAKSKVAFVGTSGAGKSSIIQLLSRFYKNYSGEILFDGKELNNYDLNNYRSLLGTVQQEPVLFGGTIRQNIQYNQQASIDQVKEAAKKANALQFIEDLSQQGKDGFEMNVGVKGNQLSGGQKQRIAISQVILRNPQILLFDEVTSALDSHNEYLVQQSIETTFNNHTTISVAHRLNPIKNCDIIFVMDQGQLVEQGTYQQLIESKSYFYQLMLNNQQE